MTELVRYPQPLKLNNVKVIFKNFRGSNESGYNEKHYRHFSVIIDRDIATELEALGYTVKWPKPNPNIDPDNDKRLPTIEIRVANNNTEPIHNTVKMIIVDENQTIRRINNNNLFEVDNLDKISIDRADVYIQPSLWEFGKKKGYTLYLKVAYFKLPSVDDPFANQYVSTDMITDNDVPF